MTHSLPRRRFLASSFALAGTAALFPLPAAANPRTRRAIAEAILEQGQRLYGPRPEERFPIPAIDLRLLDPVYYRQLVDDPTGERPGTIVVDPYAKFLYLVQPEGQAIRYGVGVGRAGFEWSGRGIIQFKRQWPRWTPPAAMIEREPELEPYRNGMEPGLDNPLGARALYIFDNGVDTLYRLHGSGEVASIGHAVSSGCVRLLHHDVIDLYNRVPTPSPILVI